MGLRYVDCAPWWGENKGTDEIGVQLGVESTGRGEAGGERREQKWSGSTSGKISLSSH